MRGTRSASEERPGKHRPAGAGFTYRCVSLYLLQESGDFDLVRDEINWMLPPGLEVVPYLFPLSSDRAEHCTLPGSRAEPRAPGEGVCVSVTDPATVPAAQPAPRGGEAELFL